jgi:hypothetical protein
LGVLPWYQCRCWFTQGIFGKAMVHDQCFPLIKKTFGYQLIIDNLNAWYITFGELKRPLYGSVIEISNFDT